MPVKIKGATSGDITLTTPAAAGTNTLTLPAVTGNVVTTADSGTVTQAMLGSGVSGNGPAFYAYAVATTSVPTSTFTKMTLDTEVFDTNNCFASSKFTPNVAGYYQINGQLTAPAANNFILMVTIYKNGSEIIRGCQTAASCWAVTASGLVYLNGTTDYVELYAYQTTGSSVSFGNVGIGTNFMSGFLARSA